MAKRLRNALFNGRISAPCCFCGRMLSRVDATLEHVVPRSKNGPTTLANCLLSCSPCNHARGNRPFDEFLREVYQAKAPDTVVAQAVAQLPGAALRRHGLATFKAIMVRADDLGFWQWARAARWWLAQYQSGKPARSRPKRDLAAHCGKVKVTPRGHRIAAAALESFVRKGPNHAT